MKIAVKLGDTLKKRGIMQKELAKKTGLTPTQISIICRGTGTGINKEHLAKITESLDITDIREIIDFAE